MKITPWQSGLLVLGALLLTTGVARNPKEVDWLALNPEFAGATFVKDSSVCLSGHEDAFKTYQKTIHHQAFTANPKTPLEALDCESCHGPRSKHVEDPGTELAFERLSSHAGPLFRSEVQSFEEVGPLLTRATELRAQFAAPPPRHTIS